MTYLYLIGITLVCLFVVALPLGLLILTFIGIYEEYFEKNNLIRIYENYLEIEAEAKR